MKNFLLLIIPVTLFFGCFNNPEECISEDSDRIDLALNLEIDPVEVGIYEDDPQFGGPLFHEPIKEIAIDDNDYSDYDSLYCFYGIRVAITDSDWRQRHTFLHVQRPKYDTDTNYWDYAVLYGKRRNGNKWEEICNKGDYPAPIDSCYDRMMKIIDVIGCEIESRLFYFDDEDWESKYHDLLCRHKVVHLAICGKTRVITPSSK